MLKRLSRASAGIVVSVLLVSGLAKRYDLNEFHAGLMSWTLIPPFLVGLLVFLVPFAEVMIGIWWWSGQRQHAATWAALGLLGCFTIAYAWQAWIAPPPNCARFGKIRAFEAMATYSQRVVPRNVMLMALLVPLLISRRGFRCSKSSSWSPSLVS